MPVAIFLLRAAAALVMLTFGWNQYRHPEAWLHTVPEWMLKLTKYSPRKIVITQAIGNLILGAFLVTGLLPILGAWLAFLWWLSILPFSFMQKKWKTATRDLSITLAILALIFLVS
jgi:hypothetical protein